VGRVTVDALTSAPTTTSLQKLKQVVGKLKKPTKIHLSESQVCGGCGAEWGGCGSSREGETAEAIPATPDLWRAKEELSVGKQI
jgi:hypothetical protein